MKWRLGRHAANTPVQTRTVIDQDTLNPLKAYDYLLKASTSRVRGRSRATSLLLSEGFRWSGVNHEIEL